MAKNTSGLLTKILEYDVKCTKNFVAFLLRFPSFKTMKVYSKYLEYSCNGILWLAMTIASIWLLNSKSYFQMQLNLLVGLIIDIILIAVCKAFVRRRRPSPCDDMLTLGPDKFSFPSGHASRAIFLLMFFIFLSPMSMIMWSPMIAWTASVCLSRLLLKRHFIVDVLAGMFIGVVEACFLSLIWINETSATNIIMNLSNDNVPGGAE
ncbi:phospholipid phosphatase 6 [Teleopsis dalmanni]|uniref:phospholipid phosphatase 6 n=1 Tax=Teleopsis dalmanni TaxID=139649 RepID=UPI0018CCD832|nr:phospholipid phosphatase 6 [Teleopsis dalmanni]